MKFIIIHLVFYHFIIIFYKFMILFLIVESSNLTFFTFLNFQVINFFINFAKINKIILIIIFLIEFIKLQF